MLSTDLNSWTPVKLIQIIPQNTFLWSVEHHLWVFVYLTLVFGTPWSVHNKMFSNLFPRGVWDIWKYVHLRQWNMSRSFFLNNMHCNWLCHGNSVEDLESQFQPFIRMSRISLKAITANCLFYFGYSQSQRNFNIV